MAMDVTIRGAGIFGLSVAWACAQAGAAVRVIDPAGVAAGASGGIVGALAPHVPENWNPKKAFQLDSLLMAERFWAEVGGASGYARTGRLQPLPDADAIALARRREGTAAQLWGEAATWKVVREAPDWAPPSPTGAWVWDDLSAHLHPRKACHALADALRSQGVDIVAQGAEEGAVIWATGVTGLEALNTGAPRLMGQGVKGQAALLSLDKAGAPQLFADALHIIPHLDGTVAVGATTENTFEHTQTDDRLDDVIARARVAVPTLEGAAVIERWAGLRPRARSRAPMLGPWPDRPGHFIANGGFKIGFGMAPKVGAVMAALVLEGRDEIPPGFEVAASA
ncbi:MAG: FAD-binding oxidoreductase [Pseudomonadota bacterium]